MWEEGHIQSGSGSDVNISHHTMLGGSVTYQVIMAANKMSVGETVKALEVCEVAVESN